MELGMFKKNKAYTFVINSKMLLSHVLNAKQLNNEKIYDYEYEYLCNHGLKKFMTRHNQTVKMLCVYFNNIKNLMCPIIDIQLSDI